MVGTTRKILLVSALLVALLPPPRAAADVLSSGDLSLDLYISFEIEQQVEAEGNGDPNGSFDADQVDIVFNYTRDKFRIAVDAVIEHGVATEEDRGNVELSFGFAEWAASPKLKLRAGKYLTPYGTHNELNSFKSGFLTVKLPFATNRPDRLSRQGFRFFPRRQVGLAVLGSLPVGGGSGSLDYDVVIGNGDQEETNPYEEDNNSQKALTGRLVWQPSLGVSLGASTYLDTITDGGEEIRQTSFGIHGAYKGPRLQCWLEVDYGELDFQRGTVRDVDQLGAYVEVGYTFANAWTPYLQVQYLAADTAARDESATVWIPGVFYRFQKYAVIKVENAYFKGSRDNRRYTDIPGRDYNELRAAVVLGF